MKLNTRYELIKPINDYKLQIGAEVGVKEGYYSYYLLKYTKLKKLYSIDNWKDGWENGRMEAETSLKHFGPRSEIMPMRSSDAAKIFKEKGIKLDFVYIDANHRYTSVKEDIAMWWSLLNDGGILAGHDYVEANGCGVIPAVNEFIKANPYLTLYLTDDHMKTWWTVKPKVVKE